MPTTCKNCEHVFEGKFCNNCGQEADVKRLDFKFLRHKIQDLVFKYFHKGILYTIKQLYSRPGHTIREYIEGRRVKHFEPIALLVTIATLYGLLYSYFHINPFFDASVSNNPTDTIDFTKVNDWMSNHFSLASCILLPLYAIGSFIAFRKQGYNFVEHLFLNTFLASQRLILRLVALPLMVIYNGTKSMHTLTDILVLFDIILIAWAYCQFFNKISKVKSLLLSIVSYLIFFISLLLIIMLAQFLTRLLMPIIS
jgi:hypothetical protein